MRLELDCCEALVDVGHGPGLSLRTRWIVTETENDPLSAGRVTRVEPSRRRTALACTALGIKNHDNEAHLHIISFWPLA